MKKINIPASFEKKAYHAAASAVKDAQTSPETPQTLSHAYKLAFQDSEFLLTDEMRGVRLQLEYEKPEIIQQWQRIESTIVMFGGSRILDRDVAQERLEGIQERLEKTPDDEAIKKELASAKHLLKWSKYYDVARNLGRVVSSSCQISGVCNFVVSTGGGPGIMEAANRGAHDVQAKSIGHNIVLPHEQAPNPYITPELCFQFHYFAIRKMHFLMRAKALICFPGGYGTLDELFEALTLIQTKKVDPIPVILVGREFWERLIDFEFLVEVGTIARKDLDIFRFAEDADEIWDYLCEYYKLKVSE
ncbi:MAG: LOG family protein [Verrucomicrobia bacterium]|jgi:uncharacterized protein (TIGR00730 family)|nr:LOG family protein [Verrucomicrobiota bacterium]